MEHCLCYSGEWPMEVFLYFEHLASESWEMCAVAQWILSLPRVQHQKTSLSICPYLWLGESTGWESSKIPVPTSPSVSLWVTWWWLRLPEGADARDDICIWDLFQRPVVVCRHHQRACVNSGKSDKGTFQIRRQIIHIVRWKSPPSKFTASCITWLTSLMLLKEDGVCKIWCTTVS